MYDFYTHLNTVSLYQLFVMYAFYTLVWAIHCKLTRHRRLYILLSTKHYKGPLAEHEHYQTKHL